MKRVLSIIGVNLAILAFIFGSYSVITSKVVDDPADVQEEINAGADPSKYDFVDITVIMEKSMDNAAVMKEVKGAISCFPVEILQGFNDDDWRIMVVSDIDFSGITQHLDNKEDTVGLTNFDDKLIQIKYNEAEGVVKLRTIHEIAHYADEYYGFPSCSIDYVDAFYDEDDPYREYELDGIHKTAINAVDLEHANENTMELFACSYKDYLLHPDYLKENNEGLYNYYKELKKSQY